MSARVHVIGFVEEGENPSGLFSKVDWTLKLPEKIQGDDARRIEYVVVRNENEDAELYRVTGWERAMEKYTVTSVWTLKLGVNVYLEKQYLSLLMESYATSSDLPTAFLKKLEELLKRGQTAPKPSNLDGVLRSSMSFSEARLAVSRFYGVEQEQVQIRIIG